MALIGKIFAVIVLGTCLFILGAKDESYRMKFIAGIVAASILVFVVGA